MILIAGPPGAGKSVQATLLEKDFNVIWLSMGELLRHSMDEEVKKKMLEGVLVSDETAERVLSEAIENVPLTSRILLDGFPRRLSQVNWFLKFVETQKRDLMAVVHIEVPLEISLQRLLKRGRTDDQEAVIKKRYRQYHDDVLPVLERLQNSSIRVVAVNGDQPVKAVHKEIVSSIKDLLQ